MVDRAGAGHRGGLCGGRRLRREGVERASDPEREDRTQHCRAVSIYSYTRGTRLSYEAHAMIGADFVGTMLLNAAYNAVL
jgi:hypothetical protein